MIKFSDVEVGSAFTVDNKEYSKIKRCIREGVPMNAYYSPAEGVKLGLFFASSVEVANA